MVATVVVMAAAAGGGGAAGGGSGGGGAIDDGLHPVLSDFRIEASAPDRIYFKSSEPIVASSVDGFDLKDHEGRSITGVTINGVALAGHYFTVSAPFRWYHNNTFDYAGGAVFDDLEGNPLYSFALQYIRNDIPAPPLTGSEYYVNAAVAASGDGKSEAAAFQTIQEGVDALSPGDKLWVKAGSYPGAGFYFHHNLATTVNTPIVIEGYRDTVGDITTQPFSYGEALSAANMPLLDGGDGAHGTGIELGENNHYLIIRNFQLTNYLYGVVSSTGSSKNRLERIVVKDIGNENNAAGYGFSFDPYSNDCHYTRLVDCVAINATEANFIFAGDNNLVENGKSYCDRGDVPGELGLPTDYYIQLRGKNNIVRHSLVDRRSYGHNGHGFALKHSNQYTLVEHSEALNIVWAFQARHAGTHHNVFRDCEAHADVPYRLRDEYDNHSGGIHIYSGAHHNIFDRIHIHHVDSAIELEKSSEDNANSSDIGHHNVVRNSIIEHIVHTAFNIRNYEPVAAGLNNNLFYNITFNRVNFEEPSTTGNGSIQGGFFEWQDDASVTASGNKLVNCIVANVPLANVYPTVPSGFTWDNNAFFNTWASEGTNPIEGDPLFVDAVNDVRLKANSPLKGKGLPLLHYDFATDERVTQTVGAYN